MPNLTCGSSVIYLLRFKTDSTPGQEYLKIQTQTGRNFGHSILTYLNVRLCNQTTYIEIRKQLIE
jgi:hypothetical protein